MRPIARKPGSDAVLGQGLFQLCAQGVGADLSEKGHSCAQGRGREGAVGPAATNRLNDGGDGGFAVLEQIIAGAQR